MKKVATIGILIAIAILVTNNAWTSINKDTNTKPQGYTVMTKAKTGWTTRGTRVTTP